MKRELVIGLSLFMFGFIQAQKSKSYIHFDLGVGNQSLNYNLVNGKEKSQLGYSVDVGYSYFFSPNWGVSIGLGAQRLATLSTLNYLAITPNKIDIVGDTYELRTDYKNWEEEQQGVFIDIPLAGQYKYYFSRKVGFLASFGAKVSFPLRPRYKTMGGEIVTTGYYSKWKVILHDLPRYGFSTYTGPYTSDLSFKPAFAGIVDIGTLYKISPLVDLYIGGYLNYGLNNIVSPGSKPVFESTGVYNSFLHSDQVSRVIPLAFGIKAGIYWKVKDKYKFMWYMQ